MLRAFRPAALLLALTAMLLGAMLPTGWMPGAGGLPVLCSLTHASGPAQPTNDSHDNHGHECPFAAAPHLAPPLTVAAIAASMLRQVAPDPATAAHPSQRLAAYAPQAPRAPPA